MTTAILAEGAQFGIGSDEIVIAILSGLFGVVLVLVRAVHKLVLAIGLPSKDALDELLDLSRQNTQSLEAIQRLLERIDDRKRGR